MMKYFNLINVTYLWTLCYSIIEHPHNTMNAFVSIFSVLLLYHFFGRQPPLRVTFERLQQLSGADVANFTGLRLYGTNDSTQFLNGSWQLLQDLDNNWIHLVRLWYQSPTTATDGTFYPVQMADRSIRVCDYLNSELYRSWWARNRYAVNYPEPQPGRWICPFATGTYHARWIVLEKGILPWVTKIGLYRMEFCLANNGIVRMVHALYVRVHP
ncbi:uncharacterized protein LOC134226155 [Armigeres subalbatus]|uniref:uncharacterized protein LOC134226155 n=1 Tax=Armigeres subalbatus TaxID=124917 RepID=UPI002ED57A2C